MRGSVGVNMLGAHGATSCFVGRLKEGGGGRGRGLSSTARR